jgi:hypothetical protein
MKLVYLAWLLSRNEQVLKLLCVACLGLAVLSYLLGKTYPVAPSDTVAPFERIHFGPDSRLLVH